MKFGSELFGLELKRSVLTGFSGPTRRFFNSKMAGVDAGGGFKEAKIESTGSSVCRLLIPGCGLFPNLDTLMQSLLQSLTKDELPRKFIIQLVEPVTALERRIKARCKDLTRSLGEEFPGIEFEFQIYMGGLADFCLAYKGRNEKPFDVVFFEHPGGAFFYKLVFNLTAVGFGKASYREGIIYVTSILAPSVLMIDLTYGFWFEHMPLKSLLEFCGFEAGSSAGSDYIGNTNIAVYNRTKAFDLDDILRTFHYHERTRIALLGLSTAMTAINSNFRINAVITAYVAFAPHLNKKITIAMIVATLFQYFGLYRLDNLISVHVAASNLNEAIEKQASQHHVAELMRVLASAEERLLANANARIAQMKDALNEAIEANAPHAEQQILRANLRRLMDTLSDTVSNLRKDLGNVGKLLRPPSFLSLPSPTSTPFFTQPPSIPSGMQISAATRSAPICGRFFRDVMDIVGNVATPTVQVTRIIVSAGWRFFQDPRVMFPLMLLAADAAANAMGANTTACAGGMTCRR